MYEFWWRQIRKASQWSKQACSELYNDGIWYCKQRQVMFYGVWEELWKMAKKWIWERVRFCSGQVVCVAASSWLCWQKNSDAKVFKPALVCWFRTWQVLFLTASWKMQRWIFRVQGFVVLDDSSRVWQENFHRGQSKVARFRSWQGNVGIGQVFLVRQSCY